MAIRASPPPLSLVGEWGGGEALIYQLLFYQLSNRLVNTAKVELLPSGIHECFYLFIAKIADAASVRVVNVFVA